MKSYPHSMNCIKCGAVLHFSNFGRVRDINGKVIRCCQDCSDSILSELKLERLVEYYKGNAIYIFEGRYYPYWGCAYNYFTIEGVRDRIDHPDISIVPTDLLGKAMRGEDLL